MRAVDREAATTTADDGGRELATDNNATIVLDSDGSYIDATPPALSLLGVTLDELRALPPGSLAADQMDEAERAALRSAFEQAGATTAVGATTLRRPDGKSIRVDFLIDRQPDGTFMAQIKPSAARIATSTVFVSAGEVLAAWRATERKLETLPADSHEAKSAEAEIRFFRSEYQRLAAARVKGRH